MLLLVPDYSPLIFYVLLYDCRSLSRHRNRLVFTTSAVLYAIASAISLSLYPSAHCISSWRQFSPISLSFCFISSRSVFSIICWITDFAVSAICKSLSGIDIARFTLFLLVAFLRTRSTHLL